MTRFLASVNSLEEAHLVAVAGVDIIDLKQPAQGALGALPVTEVAAIVRALKPQATLSATIGDLPLVPEVIVPAVEAMVATGVDFVKIGFFPGGDCIATLHALQLYTRQDQQLIAVLFADGATDFSVLNAIAAAGFSGVMLDTMDKRAGRLMDHLPIKILQDFCKCARDLNMLSGLAGSLRAEDVALLQPLNPDYLGFRGALCSQHQRTSAIDRQRLAQIRQLLSVHFEEAGVL